MTNGASDWERGMGFSDIVRGPDDVYRADDLGRDVAGMSSIAEALGLSFSTDDYAGSVAGIVSRVAKLHAECFGLKAEAALAKSEPSQSVRDALDRMLDAIGLANHVTALVEADRKLTERAKDGPKKRKAKKKAKRRGGR